MHLFLFCPISVKQGFSFSKRLCTHYWSDFLFSVKQGYSFSKRILYSTSVYAPSLVQCTFSLPLIFSSNKFTCTLITLQIDPSWPKNPTASDNGTCKYIQFNKVVLFIMSNAPFYLSKFGLDWCTQKGVVEHAYDCSHFCHFLLPLISWQSRKVPVFTTAGQSPERARSAQGNYRQEVQGTQKGVVEHACDCSHFCHGTGCT